MSRGDLLNLSYNGSKSAAEDAVTAQILNDHAYHIEHNAAYKALAEEVGVGKMIDPADMHRLLRTDREFKSYFDKDPSKGIPFPEDQPQDFIKWLNYMISDELELNPDKFEKKYKTFEDFLNAIEGQGLVIGHSSGSTGVFTTLPMSKEVIGLTARSYMKGCEEIVGIDNNYGFVAIMPEKTHMYIALAGKMVGDQLAESYYSIPEMSADILRLKSGRLKGSAEIFKGVAMKLAIPIMRKKMTEKTIEALEKMEGKNTFVFGNQYLMDKIARVGMEKYGFHANLGEGSVIATGGGNKEGSMEDPERINDTMREFFGDYPIVDIMGAAELRSMITNCVEGGYKHVAPWALVDVIEMDPATKQPIKPLPREGEQTGLLAVYDPLHGDVLPGNFIMGDEVTIDFDGCNVCGREGPVIKNIKRVSNVQGRGCAQALGKI